MVLTKHKSNEKKKLSNHALFKLISNQDRGMKKLENTAIPALDIQFRFITLRDYAKFGVERIFQKEFFVRASKMTSKVMNKIQISNFNDIKPLRDILFGRLKRSGKNENDRLRMKFYPKLSYE